MISFGIPQYLLAEPPSSLPPAALKAITSLPNPGADLNLTGSGTFRLHPAEMVLEPHCDLPAAGGLLILVEFCV